jgi:hypothetical protein
MAGGVARTGKITRCRWEDNIKVDLLEVGWSDDWIHLDQDRANWRALMNMVMHLQVP